MKKILEILRSIGPAIIVAAVVCGPGSMLMSSKTGAIYGYQMVWVLALAALLMWSMVVLSARLGVVHEHTLLQELANRLGRPVAATVGIFLFLVVAGFQVSNNVAILAAIESFMEKEGSTVPALEGKVGLSIGILTFLNLLVIGVIYRFGNLYKPVERLLKGIVLIVVMSFAINLFLAKPDIGSVLRGLVPSPPEGGFRSFFSSPTGNANVTILQALIATTFSVAGAFFQAYSVRAKGWGLADAKKGMIDSLAGIAVLGGVSLILMTTAAAALHGKVDGAALNSVSDLARQFEPLFGHNAKIVFGIGIFAGGFGAFMVNALIGGNMLADGFGKGATMNDRGTKHATVVALLLGMGIAVGCLIMGIKPVAAITVAQASTVLGLPALALALLYLATRPELTGNRKIPRWMIAMGSLGLLLTVLLTLRTVIRLYAQFAG